MRYRIATLMLLAGASPLPAVNVIKGDPAPNVPADGDVLADGGIRYTWTVEMGEDETTAGSLVGSVGAWSWDEDGFPETAKGWTHTSNWIALELSSAVNLTLTLGAKGDVANLDPDALDPSFGGDLYPGFSIYEGWDGEGGDSHTFNNTGQIEWADVTYIGHANVTDSHELSHTWALGAGRYSISLGGNSPATDAEPRQGYLAELSTTAVPEPSPILLGALAAVSLSARRRRVW